MAKLTNSPVKFGQLNKTASKPWVDQIKNTEKSELLHKLVITCAWNQDPCLSEVSFHNIRGLNNFHVFVLDPFAASNMSSDLNF